MYLRVINCFQALLKHRPLFVATQVMDAKTGKQHQERVSSNWRQKASNKKRQILHFVVSEDSNAKIKTSVPTCFMVAPNTQTPPHIMSE